MILQSIRASCVIPQTFHPLDIVSSPTPYPEHEGILIEDAQDGVGFYVDGGIATPAPVKEQEAEGDERTTRTVISPVVGTSLATERISPRDRGGWWLPQVRVRHDMGVRLSLFNLRALQMATGNVSSTELRNRYQRGYDDADWFSKSPLLK